MNPLARIAYNIVAEGGDDVMRAAKGVAKKVDIGAAKEAVKRVADDVVDSAGDWGWKGGKPGEITGTQFANMRDNAEDNVINTLKAEGLDEFNMRDNPMMNDDYIAMQEAKANYYNDLYTTAREQLRPKFGELKSSYDVDEWMNQFAQLEKADTPRKWTGKIVRALNDSGIYVEDKFDARYVRSAMESLSDAERQDLLDLLPTLYDRAWNTQRTGLSSFELPEVGKFVKTTYSALNPTERETFLALLPEWTESLDDLAGAVRTF